jgi:hypothetical protein
MSEEPQGRGGASFPVSADAYWVFLRPSVSFIAPWR